MSKILQVDVNATFDNGNTEGVVITLDNGKEVKFGIDNNQRCCERWGYLHSVDDTSAFIGAEYQGIIEKDTWPESLPEEHMYDGGFQAIDVLTSAGVMQFVVYNDHNGYYSHATILVDGDAIKDSCL